MTEPRRPSRLQRSISGCDIPLVVEEEANTLVLYRSTGLGIWGAALRFVGMPLERIALIANSTQACDVALSQLTGTARVPYGPHLMVAPSKQTTDTSERLRYVGKTSMVPLFAGVIESVVANRAEVQRYYGIGAFGKIEQQLAANPLARACGPAFTANAMRNFVMSSTSFVLTPTLYQLYYPQERKSTTSLFWFGLGLNIFVGNVVAITQQALWGRALDDCAVGGGRSISYSRVVREGLSREGFAAFFTPSKWFTRVMMNAPAQGTIPWFYNEVLPHGEQPFLRALRSIQGIVTGPSKM